MGLLSFVTNYIRTIGFIIGLVQPVLLALLDSRPCTAIAALACYIVSNLVVEALIQGKFIGEAAGLSIILTLLSLIIWTRVLGPLGAVLAIPLTAFVRALLLNADSTTHWASELIARRRAARNAAVRICPRTGPASDGMREGGPPGPPLNRDEPAFVGAYR